MSELLFEIRSGEIPALMQSAAREQLQNLTMSLLKAYRIPHGSVHPFVGPRRIGACVQDVAPMQEGMSEEIRGPKTSAPEAALQGFLKRLDITKDALTILRRGKGDYYAYHRVQEGAPTKSLLAQLLTELMGKFTWPKTMRWGDYAYDWIRPITGGLCVFDGHPVTFTLKNNQGRAVVDFAGTTVGHRILAPGAIVVTDFASYCAKLRAHYVIADDQERRDIVRAQVQACAEEQGLSIIPDEKLLAEVTGLVEWPHAVVGEIAKEFMSLPIQVLRTVMRVHQRHFALVDGSGTMAPKFVLVADHNPSDGGAKLRDGNERVVTARFADAQFFIHQDRMHPLGTHAQKLDTVLLHEKLGTMDHKQSRVAQILQTEFPETPEAADAAAAAAIFKADLTTELVGEFPELQGIVGGYYAAQEGYAPDVCRAISEQYHPRGPLDHLPSTRAGKLLALCDRVDTLVAFFGINIIPTGSKDPFALRRAGLGIVRLLGALPTVTLRPLLAQALALLAAEGRLAQPQETVMAALESFLQERIRTHWRDCGFDLGVIDALLTRDVFSLYVVQAQNLIQGLSSSLKDPAMAPIFKAVKRAYAILDKPEHIPGPGAQTIAREMIREESEVALLQALDEYHDRAQNPTEASNAMATASGLLAHLAPLAHRVNVFFDHVLVETKDPDVARNRKAMVMDFLAHADQAFPLTRLCATGSLAEEENSP